eukprot:NODE_180_length_15790_cov_0.586706.p5 type:complete len:289 gc:universal NODE_180_length_15790_cov_0.586706:12294-11428(-)
MLLIAVQIIFETMENNENSSTYLASVLESIRYQKEVTSRFVEQLSSKKEELMNLPLESLIQNIKSLSVPHRMPILHSMDTILPNLSPDLVKRYRLKYIENKESKPQKQKLKINWSVEEIELLEKKLLVQHPIDGNHKQRLKNLSKQLPSKSPKQIQVRLNKFYLKTLKENKPLLGARYSPVIPEKKRGRPSKLVSTSPVMFSDYEKNEEFLDHNKIHYATMCEVCGNDPIIGTRYHCDQCQVDVCENCYAEESVRHTNHNWTCFEDNSKSSNTDEYAYLKGIWGGNRM